LQRWHLRSSRVFEEVAVSDIGRPWLVKVSLVKKFKMPCSKQTTLKNSNWDGRALLCAVLPFEHRPLHLVRKYGEVAA
jgi:hypothetical protein